MSPLDNLEIKRKTLKNILNTFWCYAGRWSRNNSVKQLYWLQTDCCCQSRQAKFLRCLWPLECKWLAVRGRRWSILTMKVIYFHFFARQGVVCNSLYSCGSRCVCDLLHQCYPYFKVTLLLTLVIIQFTVTDMRTSPHLWQLLIPRCVSWTWNVRYFQSSSIDLPLYFLPHV